jgi:hypothetical protein
MTMSRSRLVARWLKLMIRCLGCDSPWPPLVGNALLTDAMGRRIGLKAWNSYARVRDETTNETLNGPRMPFLTFSKSIPPLQDW